MIEFEVFGATTTLAHPAIAREDNAFRAFRNIAALGKTTELYQQQQ
jgi:hypothetical protein